MLAELCPLPSSPTQIQKVLFLHLITDKRRRYGSRPSMELIDDLVVEILLRLPAKFVARSRCVSKRWLSISSDPKFIRSHRLRHHSLSGFFLSNAIRKTTYFPIDSSSPPPPPVLYPTVSLPGIAGGLDWTLIDGCCNDFIIYRSRERLLRSADIFAYPLEYRPVIHLYNLKTLEHTRLLAPEKLNGYSQIVIFDPSRFPGEYKLISSGVRMHLFSSKNRSWKVLFDRSPMPKVRSVYWEGSLVWLNEKLTRLDVQGECVSTMPWPGTGMISCHYLGESRGWLHFIGSSSPENILDSMCFDIFTIQSMDSGWSVLHRVDIGAIKDVYPEVIPPTEGEGEGQHSNPYPRLAISVVYFHRGIGGKGRGDQLLLSIPGKIVSYNLQDKNFMTVTDNVVGRNEGVEALSSKTEYRWWHFFPLPPALSTL